MSSSKDRKNESPIAKMAEAFIESVSNNTRIDPNIKRSAEANISKLDEMFRALQFRDYASRLLRTSSILGKVEYELVRRLDSSMADLPIGTLTDIADAVGRINSNLTRSVEALRFPDKLSSKQKKAIRKLMESGGDDKDDNELLSLARSSMEGIFKEGVTSTDLERMVNVDRLLRGKKTGGTGAMPDVNIIIEGDNADGDSDDKPE